MRDLRAIVTAAAVDPERVRQAQALLERNRAYARTQDTYQTALDPQEEAVFRAWVAQGKVPFDPEDPLSDYDMRGYWKDLASKGQGQTEINVNDNLPHYPDTYKTPYHKSFSNESRYALPTAPGWNKDHQLVDPRTGQVVYDERAPRP